MQRIIRLDGREYFVVADLCRAVGLNVCSQRQKLIRKAWNTRCAAIFDEKTQRVRPHICLAMDQFRDWVDSLQHARLTAHQIQTIDTLLRSPFELCEPASDGPDSRQHWKTPQKLFEHFRDRYALTRDACAKEDGSNALLPDYWHPNDSGLQHDWRLWRIWCNPPYAEIAPWVQKASKTIYTGRNGCAVLLVPARTDQAWWRTAVESASGIYFLRGRVRFEPPPSVKASSNPFSSVIFVFDGSGAEKGYTNIFWACAKCGKVHAGKCV